MITFVTPNMTIMKDRFNKIIEVKGLTATKFATLIGVHASAVSHILNGRSKPGFDVLAKIIQTFPDISLDWLVAGKGSMYNSMVETPQQLSLPDWEENREVKKKKEVVEVNHAPIQTTLISPIDVPMVSTKKIKRIILFFEDGSFEDYIK